MDGLITYIKNGKTTNTSYTYGYKVKLTEDYPTCYHDSFYGFSIYFDSDYASTYYYAWSESSGTCTVGTTNSTYTTSGTPLRTSNDFDGTDDDPCGYTYYL